MFQVEIHSFDDYTLPKSISDIYQLLEHAQPEDELNLPGDIYELASHTGWSSFIKILGSISSSDRINLSHKPFVRACNTQLKDELDGVTELMARYVVQDFVQGSSESQDVHGEPIEAASPSDDASDETSEDDTSSSDSQPSKSSIDVSLEGHVLPGKGKHTNAVVPLLCLADGQNILDLMISLACQRFVWGISEPAIGFALSSSAPVMELVVSWLDPSTRILHITHDIGRPTIGSFDFTALPSILRFSKFVLGLSPSIASIVQAASRSCEKNKLNWRADGPQFDGDLTSTERVTRWVYDIQNEPHTDEVLECHPSSDSAAPTPILGEEATNGLHFRVSTESSVSESIGPDPQSQDENSVSDPAEALARRSCELPPPPPLDDDAPPSPLLSTGVLALFFSLSIL
ncbi:hypothetical protein FB45DRAFT_1067218 [Roridomyces roridus]|uniref:Uncharacterized protein n=1 Tax=Roridomyces roridus TaxID=1738132 RepID=A0AAD7B2E1_9AGAR|nr:hypothetical protein FB45DRAFT_1067218 [Roridomyces roridus]